MDEPILPEVIVELLEEYEQLLVAPVEQTEDVSRPQAEALSPQSPFNRIIPRLCDFAEKCVSRAGAQCPILPRRLLSVWEQGDPLSRLVMGFVTLTAMVQIVNDAARRAVEPTEAELIEEIFGKAPSSVVEHNNADNLPVAEVGLDETGGLSGGLALPDHESFRAEATAAFIDASLNVYSNENAATTVVRLLFMFGSAFAPLDVLRTLQDLLEQEKDGRYGGRAVDIQLTLNRDIANLAYLVGDRILAAAHFEPILPALTPDEKAKLAMCYDWRGDKKKALDLYRVLDLAVLDDDARFSVLRRAGEICVGMGNWADAQSYLSAAVYLADARANEQEDDWYSVDPAANTEYAGFYRLYGYASTRYAWADEPGPNGVTDLFETLYYTAVDAIDRPDIPYDLQLSVSDEYFQCKAAGAALALADIARDTLENRDQLLEEREQRRDEFIRQNAVTLGLQEYQLSITRGHDLTKRDLHAKYPDLPPLALSDLAYGKFLWDQFGQSCPLHGPVYFICRALERVVREGLARRMFDTAKSFEPGNRYIAASGANPPKYWIGELKGSWRYPKDITIGQMGKIVGMPSDNTNCFIAAVCPDATKAWLRRDAARTLAKVAEIRNLADHPDEITLKHLADLMDITFRSGLLARLIEAGRATVE